MNTAQAIHTVRDHARAADAFEARRVVRDQARAWLTRALPVFLSWLADRAAHALLLWLDTYERTPEALRALVRDNLPRGLKWLAGLITARLLDWLADAGELDNTLNA